jgi:hypothetical protein
VDANHSWYFPKIDGQKLPLLFFCDFPAFFVGTNGNKINYTLDSCIRLPYSFHHFGKEKTEINISYFSRNVNLSIVEKVTFISNSGDDDGYDDHEEKTICKYLKKILKADWINATVETKVDWVGSFYEDAITKYSKTIHKLNKNSNYFEQNKEIIEALNKPDSTQSNLSYSVSEQLNLYSGKKSCP